MNRTQCCQFNVLTQHVSIRAHGVNHPKLSSLCVCVMWKLWKTMCRWIVKMLPLRQRLVFWVLMLLLVLESAVIAVRLVCRFGCQWVCCRGSQFVHLVVPSVVLVWCMGYIIPSFVSLFVVTSVISFAYLSVAQLESSWRVCRSAR